LVIVAVPSSERINYQMSHTEQERIDFNFLNIHPSWGEKKKPGSNYQTKILGLTVGEVVRPL
jgi:hypothetical protein